MPKYRVKAYYMHENEQAAALNAVNSAEITEAEWTPGYVIGVVDSAAIESLSKQGLVISLIEQVQQADTPADQVPGIFSLSHNSPLIVSAAGRPVPVIAEARTPSEKVLSHAKSRSEYYVVRFHGPITKARHRELASLDVKLLERVSRNKYTVRLTPSQVRGLAEQPFVDIVRLYNEEDTWRTRPVTSTTPSLATAGMTLFTSGVAPIGGTQSRRTGIFTVKLHRAQDMRVVVRWLARHNRKPIWKRRDHFQVALVEGSKTMADLIARPEVAIVEQVEVPRLHDDPARTILGLLRDSKRIGLEGAGEIIGIADTGVDHKHPDLVNRIAGKSAWGRINDTSDPDGHGTHVAGCAVGDGSASNGEVLGAAPKAKLFFQSILDANGGIGGLPNDLGKLFQEAYDQGVRIHNNSWGAFTFARYAENSLDVDRFVHAHPDMLVVIAAGNDGIGVPRATGASLNSTRGFVDWPSVAAPATAKNCLTVGASRSMRKKGGLASLTWGQAWPDRYPHPPIAQELISDNSECLAAFSSRGPSDDSRFKPEVVAPGTDIAAAKSKDAPLRKFWGAYPNNKQYGFMGGTSMAAPYVAGCAALVREWFRTGGWATPSAALLKATLINGSKRITGADAVAPLNGDPNFHQGFGRIDMSITIPNVLSPGLQLQFEDTWKTPSKAFKETGQRLRYQINVGSQFPFRITLAWTDPPARGLQNSLVLMVDDAAHTKFVGNAQAATLLNVAGGPRDPNNNVQVIRIAKPTPGVYTIAITASMLLLPPQSFALVVTGDIKSGLTLLP